MSLSVTFISLIDYIDKFGFAQQGQENGLRNVPVRAPKCQSTLQGIELERKKALPLIFKKIKINVRGEFLCSNSKTRDCTKYLNYNTIRTSPYVCMSVQTSICKSVNLLYQEFKKLCWSREQSKVAGFCEFTYTDNGLFQVRLGQAR